MKKIIKILGFLFVVLGIFSVLMGMAMASEMSGSINFVIGGGLFMALGIVVIIIKSGNIKDYHQNNKEDEIDELYEAAKAVVIETKRASASLLQRRLKIGYARATWLLDLLEKDGLIGPRDGAESRDVYVKNSI